MTVVTSQVFANEGQFFESVKRFFSAGGCERSPNRAVFLEIDEGFAVSTNALLNPEQTSDTAPLM